MSNPAARRAALVSPAPATAAVTMRPSPRPRSRNTSELRRRRGRTCSAVPFGRLTKGTGMPPARSSGTPRARAGQRLDRQILRRAVLQHFLAVTFRPPPGQPFRACVTLQKVHSLQTIGHFPLPVLPE